MDVKPIRFFDRAIDIKGVWCVCAHECVYVAGVCAHTNVCMLLVCVCVYVQGERWSLCVAHCLKVMLSIL